MLRTPTLQHSNTPTNSASRFFLLDDDIPIVIHFGFLLRMNHRGGVELFDDRRAVELEARLKKIAIKNLRCQRAVFFAEEDFALARLCLLDSSAGLFSRRELRLRHQAERNEPQTEQLDGLGLGFVTGVLLVHGIEALAHYL